MGERVVMGRVDSTQVDSEYTSDGWGVVYIQVDNNLNRNAVARVSVGCFLEKGMVLACNIESIDPTGHYLIPTDMQLNADTNLIALDVNSKICNVCPHGGIEMDGYERCPSYTGELVLSQPISRRDVLYARAYVIASELMLNLRI